MIPTVNLSELANRAFGALLGNEIGYWFRHGGCSTEELADHMGEHTEDVERALDELLSVARLDSFLLQGGTTRGPHPRETSQGAARPNLAGRQYRRPY